MRRDNETLTGTVFALVAAGLFASLGPLSRFAAEAASQRRPSASSHGGPASARSPWPSRSSWAAAQRRPSAHSGRSATVFVTISRNGYSEVPAETATIVILVGSTVGAAILALATGFAADLLIPFGSPEPWPVILVAGVLAADLPSFLFLTAIRRIGGMRTGILMLWEPVVGVVLAALLLGERLGPVQVAGGALVLGAALILQVASDPADEPIAGPVDIV